jgi:ribosomal protein L5
MRALAASKASAIQKERRKSSKRSKERHSRQNKKIGEKITLRSPSSSQILDTFSAESENFLHQDLSRKKHVIMKITQGTKAKIPGLTHTSSEELVD